MAINLGNTEYLGSSSRVGSAGYVSSQSAVSGASMLNPSSLKSGQTISGEVVAQDGNNVTLKLTNGQLLNARLDNNAGVVAGKMLSFEVSTGNNTIALRPLYANLNANSTISSALKAAGLPLTQTNIDMTKAMMQEGMSINRNALLDMARNVYTMPGSDPASIVQMVKIGLPIDELTVREFENYKNFEHQIINDVNDLSSEVSSLISDAISTGNGDSIGEVMQLMELIDAGNIEAEEAADAMQTSDSINALPENISSAVIDEQIIGQNELTEDLASGTTDAGSLNMAEESADAKSAGIMDTIRDAISSKVNELVSTLNGDAAADNQSSVINAARDSVNDMNNSLKALADYLNVSFDENMSDPQKFQFIKDSIALLSSTKGENGVNAQLLSHIKNVIDNDSTGKLIEKAVKSQLTLSPEKVAKDGAVDDLYNRILKISQKVVDMASQNPEHFAEAAKSAQNLQNNVNFMNQVNQVR